jgi:hypothetical protein
MIHAVLAPLKVNHGGKSSSREIFCIDREFAYKIVKSAASCSMTPEDIERWKEEWTKKVAAIAPY